MANSGTYNHTKIHFAEGSAPATPDTGEWVIYAKTTGMFVKDDAGVEYGPFGDASAAAAHIADATDAHDASAISVLDTGGNFTGTDVEAVLAELQDNIDGLSGGGGAFFDSGAIGSPQASFDITSIPAGAALRILLSGRTDRASNVEEHIRLRFNNDSGSNYDWTMNPLYEAVNTTSGFDEAFGGTGMDRILSLPGATATASRAGSGEILVIDHAGTTFHKSVIARGAHAFGTSSANIRSIEASGLWRSTAAITRATLTCLNGANFIAGTRCLVYVVAA